MNMTEKDALVAFLACLVAIILLAVCGVAIASLGKDWAIIAGAISGLIGVIGTFRPKSNNVGASTSTGDVNAEKKS